MLTLSKHPYPIESTAFSSRGVRPGLNADLFRLSQPRGAVTTTSSKDLVAPSDVVILAFSGLLPAVEDSIVVTFLSYKIVALSSAGFATWSRILWYVSATKGFSPSMVSSSQ